MSDYGAIGGYEAGEPEEGGIDGANGRRRSEVDGFSSPSVLKEKSRELASRPWARGIAALLAVLLVASLASSRHGNLRTKGTGAGAGAGGKEVAPEKQDEKQTAVRELFYDDQLVDHFGGGGATWSNRYYTSTKYFRGPGHPVFLIIGGEGSLDPNPLSSDGMLYPFVTQHLAPKFGAAVIEVEHRFYGPYQPIVERDATVEELIRLLTPQQAMADMIQLVKHFKDQLRCSEYDRSSELYCPVITVGGSYPGFLSAMFRLVHPDVVDVAYASSAPLKLYDQTADQDAYYDIVTKAAERLSPGCADAVRSALEEAKVRIEEASSVEEAVEEMNVCYDTVPEYIAGDAEHPWLHLHLDALATLSADITMAIGFSFADFDMDAYPPSEELGLYKACRVFQDEEATTMEKVKNFFELLGEDPEAAKEYPDRPGDEDRDCFDLSVFLPDGENARIATSDWSGSGGGNDGKMWDFQLCTTLVDPIGFSEESMFPARKWTYEDLTRYCQLRYGTKVTPQPLALVRNLHFDDLVAAGGSHILFTNGLQDMWSGGSYLEDVSDTILALNFENGAHHSDLTHVGPTEDDTDDVREGFVKIADILDGWLREIKRRPDGR